MNFSLLHKKKQQAGLTLVELLVCVGIVVIATAVLMFNYNAYKSDVSVRTLAQDIALQIRKAQTFATSARLPSSDGYSAFSPELFPAYGVAFSIDTSANYHLPYGVFEKQFVLFADIPEYVGYPGNGLYNGGTICGVPQQGNECVEMSSIRSGDRIVSMWTDTFEYVKMANVLFHRPVPDADICVVTDRGPCSVDGSSYLAIEVLSLQGKTKIITVWNTGQISVESGEDAE